MKLYFNLIRKFGQLQKRRHARLPLDVFSEKKKLRPSRHIIAADCITDKNYCTHRDVAAVRSVQNIACFIINEGKHHGFYTLDSPSRPPDFSNMCCKYDDGFAEQRFSKVEKKRRFLLMSVVDNGD